MRITILQGAFLPIPPLLGGAVEKMWFRLGKDFAAQGHPVTHVSRLYGDLPAEETIRGVRHVRVRGYEQPRSLFKLKALDILYSRRACQQVPADSDIVVTNTFWAPMLLPKCLSARAYVDIQRMPKGQCRYYSRAGRLRANSTPVAEAIRRELPTAQHTRVSMIPNPLPFDPPAVLELDAKEKAILYCGRVHQEKGLDLLIRASRGLPAGWTVEIVGPWETKQGGGGEDYRDHLHNLAQGLPVTFHGPVFDMEQLSGFYRRASIFVYPSVAEKGETFGLSPLEAMAWGCAPVVSDLACFKDFIHNGSNGLIFNHRDPDAVAQLTAAMRILIDDVPQRLRLAGEASRVGETHSAVRIANQFLADFEKLFQGLSSMA